ncbi:rRNA maturation RNase YbeY [Campylobacter sp. 19-13652]|uniref:rRNA maturation RNase YbeY n=1 Tax=Campylobacter sp. 19-13652 TaxID=2840180 RepID=UPI001C7700A1|nr:rRNA maturation RNase YbeY [Campylobacter sp. 19-13652]BCX79076.1 endoribonuclease YbeY [Campylobacter sp. 19-13652]
MIICEQSYDEILDKICAHLTDKDVELVFVNSKQIREINLSHRGIDKPTDVLSFPLFDAGQALSGSIVINEDAVGQMASELGHSAQDERALLFTHGLLHILGFDHEIDNGEMREKESEVVRIFGLPKSLIVRNDG